MSTLPLQNTLVTATYAPRILVVDDDASILGVVAEVLEDDGYKVSTAGSGEEAVEILKKQSFSLVMSDIRLPGMNGIALLEHVKAVTPSTYVIMITSHGSLDTSIKAMKNGAFEYLLKPFDNLAMISEAAGRALDAYKDDAERSQMIRSLKQSNDKLSQLNQIFHGLAIRDGLTDLFNHRHINDILDREIERCISSGSDLSVIFLDVDSFKAFNDQYGHQNGDLLLRELSLVMRDNVRGSDFLARWGGEEFVIVCPNLDEHGTAVLAEKLRAAIEAYAFSSLESDVTRHVTISAGVASQGKYTTKPALIEAADQALYKAKREGRNKVHIAGF